MLTHNQGLFHFSRGRRLEGYKKLGRGTARTGDPNWPRDSPCRMVECAAHKRWGKLTRGCCLGTVWALVVERWKVILSINLFSFSYPLNCFNLNPHVFSLFFFFQFSPLSCCGGEWLSKAQVLICPVGLNHGTALWPGTLLLILFFISSKYFVYCIVLVYSDVIFFFLEV